MNKMKWWLKRFWCWLSGGHAYESGNLQSHHIPEKGVTCFIQRCLKCGEYQVYAVNDEALYCCYEMPKKIEVNFDGNE